jgi:hypothetical protein
LVHWLRDEQRPEGPRGPITFATSVRMTVNLKKPILRLPDVLWKPYREDTEAVSECADLTNYWPEEEDRPEGAGPLRYLAIRVKKRQGELFADGNEFRYFAVATNQWEWSAKKLLEWHREKAGSIEALHDVLKKELAAGVMPCGRFGANAAWLGMAVLTHNVLTGLKPAGSPAGRADPKERRSEVRLSLSSPPAFKRRSSAGFLPRKSAFSGSYARITDKMILKRRSFPIQHDPENLGAAMLLGGCRFAWKT